jgi:hypothetical protein
MMKIVRGMTTLRRFFTLSMFSYCPLHILVPLTSLRIISRLVPIFSISFRSAS